MYCNCIFVLAGIKFRFRNFFLIQNTIELNFILITLKIIIKKNLLFNCSCLLNSWASFFPYFLQRNLQDILLSAFKIIIVFFLIFIKQYKKQFLSPLKIFVIYTYNINILLFQLYLVKIKTRNFFSSFLDYYFVYKC